MWLEICNSVGEAINFELKEGLKNISIVLDVLLKMFPVRKGKHICITQIERVDENAVLELWFQVSSLTQIGRTPQG
jgi:hypothetical protein